MLFALIPNQKKMSTSPELKAKDRPDLGKFNWQDPFHDVGAGQPGDLSNLCLWF